MEKTQLQQGLGEGGLAVVMRGLQQAHQLQAELHSGPCMEANKTQHVLQCLLEIVNSLNQGIQKLSSPPPQIPPLKHPSHSHLNLGHSQAIAKVKDLQHSPRKLKKCIPKFTFKVQGVDERFNDNFTWRKYGQKTILGRRYPRSYYRCIHKGDLNCPASKQVQQCDGNDACFDITYVGKHTCEGIRAQNDAASPRLSPLRSNSYTSLASTQELNASHREPSLSICKIELGEEVQCSGLAATTMSRLHSLLEHEMVLPTSLEEIADNYNFLQVKEQYEESHNSTLPTWDFESFPAFVDFESQL